jgi:hypothetical protein
MTKPKRQPPLEGNPFATRRVRPGAIDYVFRPQESADQLIDILRTNQWFGQIVGPHGSGKSTLLESLVEPLEQAGRRLVRATLHDGQRNLPIELEDQSNWNATTQVIVDGYEQLSRSSRRRLTAVCTRQGAGLLTTTHAPTGLPTLYRSGVTLDQAQEIVAGLLPSDWDSISGNEIADAFAQHHGDLRETLFTLYDLYEQRR